MFVFTKLSFCFCSRSAAVLLNTDLIQNEGQAGDRCQEGSVLSAAELNGFGELPSKNALVASVLGTFLAPISSLAFVLDQIRMQKDGSAAAAE